MCLLIDYPSDEALAWLFRVSKEKWLSGEDV